MAALYSQLLKDAECWSGLTCLNLNLFLLLLSVPIKFHGISPTIVRYVTNSVLRCQIGSSFLATTCSLSSHWPPAGAQK